MHSLAREHIRKLQGYTPGEQPAANARIVKLNTNENTFPPSPKVLAAVRDIEPEMLRRYPQPLADEFRHAAAELHGVEPSMILCGNGSDDVLTVATRTFVGPGGRLAVPSPTYSLYHVLAGIEDATIVEVPWDAEWSLPVELLVTTEAHAIYLANPNAPSGTFVEPAKISELAAAFPGLVLVDEAYANFADDDCISLVKKHANVVISRTLSKGYSLAGLRFGYAIARPEVIAEMNKVKDSYNCDAVSITAATAAIRDGEYAAMTWKHVRDERVRVTAGLEQLGFSVLPSHTNFVLATPPDGKGEACYRGLKSQGILVRYFNLPGLTDKVRITIGSSGENNALLSGMAQLVGEPVAS